jgi:ribose transport system ATP-binding protein
VRAAKGVEVLKIENLNNGVLKNINFSLRRGEVLGIAGLLGSGRTELARAIFGVDRIESGKIYVKGELQRIKSPRRAINLGIGFLTEDRKTQGLVLVLSVKENICLPSIERFSSLGLVKAKTEDQAAERFVKELRIKTPGTNQKVIYLSGGNQQKVVLSKWLCCEADIFIFDEPTRGIDVGSKAEIYQLMNQLTASGVAVIMISSELPEILGMSDRILVMHQGRITGEMTADEATQEKLLHCALDE